MLKELFKSKYKSRLVLTIVSIINVLLFAMSIPIAGLSAIGLQNPISVLHILIGYFVFFSPVVLLIIIILSWVLFNNNESKKDNKMPILIALIPLFVIIFFMIFIYLPIVIYIEFIG